MKSKQIFFYALKDDLKDLVEFIEINTNIQYAETGLLDKKVSSISSLIPIVESNYLEYGNWNFNSSYLIFPKGQNLNIREVPQRKGGIKFAVDQMINENSVVLSLGGMYNEEAVIASEISTISNTVFSKDILKILRAYFKKYKKIKGFYVTESSLKKAEEGWRLTTDVKASPDYDLTVNK